MGREARRVPLDFDWPLKKVWGGYLLPDRLHEETCPECGGSGSTDALKWVQTVAYLLSALADDTNKEQRGRPMHPWLQPLKEISFNASAGRPGPQFVEFFDGLTSSKVGGGDRIFGRDTYRTAFALIEAAGLPEEWGWCPGCAGLGSIEKYDGQRAEAESWESVDPPSGEGWQMWETTSEGSPMSPVFATADELATWLAQTGASMFGETTATKERWLAIITGTDFAHVQIAPGVVIM